MRRRRRSFKIWAKSAFFGVLAWEKKALLAFVVIRDLRDLNELGASESSCSALGVRVGKMKSKFWVPTSFRRFGDRYGEFGHDSFTKSYHKSEIFLMVKCASVWQSRGRLNESRATKQKMFFLLKNTFLPFKKMRSWSLLLNFDTKWAGTFWWPFCFDVLLIDMTNFETILSRNHISKVRSSWWWTLRVCDKRSGDQTVTNKLPLVTQIWHLEHKILKYENHDCVRNVAFFKLLFTKN